MSDAEQKLTGFKVNLEPFDYEERLIGNDGKVVTQKGIFNVKETIAKCLFLTDLNLTFEQAFESKKLADRVREANGFIILDKQDMQKLRSVYNILRSPAEHELEFGRRIKEAEEVPLEEAK
jgi:hypothetical protein